MRLLLGGGRGVVDAAVVDGDPNRTTWRTAAGHFFSRTTLGPVMAENPIGTTDEEWLVPLRVRDGEFRIDVTRPVRTVDASPGESVA